MFVCEKCHERDRRVTKCDLDTESHGLIWHASFQPATRVNGTCSVCGRPKSKLIWCYDYEVIGRSENESRRAAQIK